MGRVVKKKKKSLFAKTVEKIKGKASSNIQDGINSDVSLSDLRISDADMAAIVSRRDELRAAKHGVSDAMVRFNGSG